jgi:hypothetical protein
MRQKKGPVRNRRTGPTNTYATAKGNTTPAILQVQEVTPGQPETTVLAECPLCARADHASVTTEQFGTSVRTKMWCHGCGAEAEPHYAGAVAEELGIKLRELLDDPRHLEPFMYDGRQPVRKRVDPLPGRAALRRAAKTLWADAWRLGYYTETRGLTPATVRRYRLGFEGCYRLPVFERGRIVNLVDHRPWAKKPVKKYMAASGHPAAFYPDVPKRRSVLLVAGMMDSLIGRQNDLPTITSTAGAAVGNHLFAKLAGRRVAVLLDAGEEAAAATAVSKLRAAGAEEAWVVPLPLPAKDDVADWFVRHGRTREELLKLIVQARP